MFSGGKVHCLESMPGTDQDVIEWLTFEVRAANQLCDARIYAVVEQIDPRPTRWKDKAGGWVSSIIKSTCQIYADYCRLKMALAALGIPYEAVQPSKWMKALGIPTRKPEETDSKWKNRLRAKAQTQYPATKISLNTSDALLIAEYCRRLREGKL